MKLIIVIVISMLLNPLNSFANQPNSKRLLLSYLRGGDYAHAGDTEAINMVLNRIRPINPNIISGNVLDMGCGFGGTLEYLKNKGFKHLYGLDINQDSINYAKTKYIGINFAHLDALNVESFFSDKKFDLVMLFNSAYAIEDKAELLLSIAKISKPGTILAIFDYSAISQDKTLPILDFAGKQMKPIELKSLLIDLKKADWNLIEIEDLSLKFIIWYNNFLETLHKQENDLKQKFLNDDIQQIDATFSYILEQLKSKRMGGVIIYAIKK